MCDDAEAERLPRHHEQRHGNHGDGIYDSDGMFRLPCERVLNAMEVGERGGTGGPSTRGDTGLVM